MKIAVLSDSHGNVNAIKGVLPQLEKCDLVVHLGDHFYDMDDFSSKLGNKLYTVYGNCDGGGEDLILDKENIKILVCHGDKYRVKAGLTRLYLRALEIGAKLVLYGHTHIANVTLENGITFINPGALAYMGKKSYCLIELNDGVIDAQIIEIEK